MMDSELATREVPLPATGGPRPHRCDTCQRSFREVATLRKHEQLHRADRPYTCNTCGKSFLWSSNLKVHERVHTGERPYKCKICHRCFTQSNDLRRHERNVHFRNKHYSYKSPTGRPLPPPGPPAAGHHMNLAAYQAFALQQRAILQHALTYETIMQNAAAAVTSSPFIHHSGNVHNSLASLPSAGNHGGDVTISTSTPISNAHHQRSSSNHDNRADEPHLPQNGDVTPDQLKLEQVSPPPSRDRDRNHDENEANNNNHHSTSNHDDCFPPPSPGRIGSSPGRMGSSPGRMGFSPTSSKANSPPTLTPSSTFGLTNGHHPSVESPESHKNAEDRDRPRSHESHHSEYTKYYNSFYHHDHGRVNDLPLHYVRGLNPAMHNSVDSVMDLSINKSVSSVDSEDVELEWKTRNMSSALSNKSPDSESESDSKRDVTTTSQTPTVDSGIHHCSHCNIFFHDFTMFNLHQSLHSPMDDHPFMCPSCGKHCQDRIEFMFHIVWHVKYPHSIPSYQTFKESYMFSDPDP